MGAASIHDKLREMIKDCKTIREVLVRFQEKGALFRPNPIETLFGHGVTAATPELLVAYEDGELCLRDAHSSSCVLVVRRAHDVVFFQAEFNLPEEPPAA